MGRRISTEDLLLLNYPMGKTVGNFLGRKKVFASFIRGYKEINQLINTKKTNNQLKIGYVINRKQSKEEIQIAIKCFSKCSVS